MKKVFVNVDYQVLSGGAIKPVRIYWHDGRVFTFVKIRRDLVWPGISHQDHPVLHTCD